MRGELIEWATYLMGGREIYLLSVLSKESRRGMCEREEEGGFKKRVL